ncbi:MAG: flagellar biosynthesis protein FlgA [Bdellovibrionales bacterium RBG_16_40_8]|nr:MAG: flagellar biosynthesis protein FlgA [Bdellovibrionales bacterium RBG_16_40_8]
MRIFLIMQILIILTAAVLNAHAARLKDIANVRGVRTNQLVGYGIIIGLNGTGDSKAEFTSNSIERMLDRLGMKLTQKDIASKNVAAVIVTAELPPFARAGNNLDVTVSSIGDASSLKGGMLIQTPLRAADQQTYAVAQGSVLVGHSATGVHETVARLPGGAMIERDMGGDFASRNMFRLTLSNPDFTTAARVAKKINMELAGKYASALDAGTVDIISPQSYEGKGVELLSTIEALDVSPDNRAKVVVNEKTGTVVVGNGVKILKVAISHGDISLKVGGEASGKKTEGDRLILFDDSANVGDIVKAINRLGVSPKDLITILQSIKAAGALQADLQIL